MVCAPPLGFRGRAFCTIHEQFDLQQEQARPRQRKYQAFTPQARELYTVTPTSVHCPGSLAVLLIKVMPRSYG